VASHGQRGPYTASRASAAAFLMTTSQMWRGANSAAETSAFHA